LEPSAPIKGQAALFDEAALFEEELLDPPCAQLALFDGDDRP